MDPKNPRIERAYTPTEIDELRAAIKRHCDDGNAFRMCWWPGETSRMFYSIKPEELELRTRTHMLAGHVAKDIIEEDRIKAEGFYAEVDRQKAAGTLKPC